MVLDRDVIAAIVDYFEPWDLVEFLGLKTRDVVDAFEDEIEDALEDILELMGLNTEDEDE